jgi:hypothetical protein
VIPAISKTETTADLAALAAKVEGFKRPTRRCEWCGGVKWGNRLEPCDKCDDKGRAFDDSPAALAMAVLVYVTTRAFLVELDDERVRVLGHGACGTMGMLDAAPESIARALLTALLRAHGVEVPSE